MLRAVRLTKYYKPKRGVPVKALNAINLTLPETGMVIILGKSGSGKSTLLNVLGGLDKYDDGDIVINGESTRSFKQSQFDSYRNTYVGFIFQEYNLLDEFSVGANIALAIELQNRKATEKEINDILNQVDLLNIANRKPNELSGGQKQRVAIARALVKNPEIIMADEPSGALDSATGKQVFDLLKKLSETKLVLVVSHDREFAERYADRIIELSDGNIIGDVEKSGEKQALNAKNKKESIEFNGDSIEIEKGYKLTLKDLEQINEYLSKLNAKGRIFSKKDDDRYEFTETNVENIEEKNKGFRLIKSKLPLKNAFKLGSSGLKHKPIRLAFTILLSFIAFTMFGVTDTLGSYSQLETTVRSITDSGVQFVPVEMQEKFYYDDDKTEFYYNESDMTAKNIEKISVIIGTPFKGVFNFNVNKMNGGMSFNNSIYDISRVEKPDTYGWQKYSSYLNGLYELTEAEMKSFGFEFAGEGMRLPVNANEIAITKYSFEIFKDGGYKDVSSETITEIKIEKPEDLIGKTIDVNSRKYSVTAVIDTKFDIDNYESLFKTVGNGDLEIFVLLQQFESELCSGFHILGFVNEGFVDNVIETTTMFYSPNNYNSWLNLYYEFDAENKTGGVAYTAIPAFYKTDFYDFIWTDNVCSLKNIKSDIKIFNLDSEITSLETDEMIISTADFLGLVSKITDKELDATDKLSYEDLESYARDCFDKFYSGNLTADGLKTALNKYELLTMIENCYYGFNSYSSGYDVMPIGNKKAKIVGIASNGGENGFVIISDEHYDKMKIKADEVYSYALCQTPKTRESLEELVRLSMDVSEEKKYHISNSINNNIEMVTSYIEILAQVFLYIGIGFAIFSSLMLSNFIGTSIAYKKVEIGILRAIGSRSADVFRIFFSESFIIAMINFILATAGTILLSVVLNNAIRYDVGMMITLLTFGIRQILLLFIISVGVAFIASFLPVRRIAAKKPIDAIRNR